MAQESKTRTSRVRRAATAQVPAELAQIIATTHDGRDITRPFIGPLEEFADKRLLGSVDWGAYDLILLDDQVKSCLEQRRSAVVSREWDVLPGDAADPRSVAAGDAFKANLEDIGWDRITDRMLYAPFHGFAVAELLWAPVTGPDGGTLIGWSDIRVRHARRFRFDKERRLRLLTTGNMSGEILPDRKFWTLAMGGSDDDQPYGRGLAEWLYWPTLFKRNAIRFWNMFLDKYSDPPKVGTYPGGTVPDDVSKLLGAIMALANDSGVAIPEGMKIALLQPSMSGVDFEKLPAYMDAAIAKIILGQTMTNTAGPTGLGSGLAEEQAGVKLEVVTTDADLLSDSFTAGPARWWTDLNFGADVAAPRVVRLLGEEEDLKTQAETDEAVARLGWRRTDESFRDIYGDGYEPKAPSEEQLGADHRAGAGKVIPLRDRREASFAEAAIAGDVVDQAVAQIMADEGWRTEVHDAFAGPLLAELARAGSEEEVRAILARAAELDDEGELVTSLERAGFALRMSAAAGQDQA
jgi:phage gp29-like protein